MRIFPDPVLQVVFLFSALWRSRQEQFRRDRDNGLEISRTATRRTVPAHERISGFDFTPMRTFPSLKEWPSQLPGATQGTRFAHKDNMIII